MKLFNFGIAKEANDYFEENQDEVWIRNDDGELILMEDEEDESDSEGQ